MLKWQSNLYQPYFSPTPQMVFMDFYDYLDTDLQNTYSREEVNFYVSSAKRTNVVVHMVIYASPYMMLFCSLLILLKITLIPAKLNILKYIFPSVNYYIQAGQNHIASTHSIFFLMIIGVTVYILRQCPFRFKVFFDNFFSSFFVMRICGVVMMVVLTVFIIVFYVPMENTCYQSEYYNRGCLGRDATKDSVYFNLFFFFYTCLCYFVLLLLILFQYLPEELRPPLNSYMYHNNQAVLDECIHGGIAPKQLYQRIKKWLADRREGVDRWGSGG